MLRNLLLLMLVAFPMEAERVRVVVVAAPGASLEARDAVLLREELIASLPGAVNVERWSAGTAFSADVEAWEVERLAADPRVRAAGIDRGGRAHLAESLPLIGADLVAAQGWDGHGVSVAVVDSGIDLTHPDFTGRIAGEQCFCENRDGSGCCPNGQKTQSGPGSAADDNGHGTHVAGILAGGGVVAPRGVAPAAKVVVVKVLNRDGDLRSFSQIAQALAWIAANHPEVRVVNMSLGSFTLYPAGGSCDASAVALGLEPLLRDFRTRGVAVVASSGNQGSVTSTALPACMATVVGVGATYDAPGSYAVFCTVTGALADQVACFTNSSADLDLLAPGAPILSAWRDGGARNGHGTSMAAPHVAGVLALMKQIAPESIGVDAMIAILRSTGTPLVDGRNGLMFPRLDAASAIAETPRPPKRRAVRH